MRVTLIHNNTAGNAAHQPPALVEMLVRAGHAVTYIRAKRDAIAAAFERPTDLIAIAGGDGTVAKVAALARPDGPPLAILPLGTANNIASSLDSARPIEEAVAGWAGADLRPFYMQRAEGAWGCRRLVEGIGFGALEHAIATLGRKKPGVAAARRHMARSVCVSEAEHLTVCLDGEEFSGGFAAFEITTIPLIGPKLRLAPQADPGARSFELCIVPDTPEQRREFSDWIASGGNGAAVPATFRRGEHVTITGEFRRLRLNDKLWPSKARAGDMQSIGRVSLAAEAEPLHFLVPG